MLNNNIRGNFLLRESCMAAVWDFHTFNVGDLAFVDCGDWKSRIILVCKTPIGENFLIILVTTERKIFTY